MMNRERARGAKGCGEGDACDFEKKHEGEFGRKKRAECLMRGEELEVWQGGGAEEVEEGECGRRAGNKGGGRGKRKFR